MKILTKAAFTLIILFSFISVYGQETASTPEFRREFLEEINHIRQKGCHCGVTYMPPAVALVWNNQLELAAIRHAEDMADRHYFSHTSKDGRTMEDRAASVGYGFKGYKSFTVGENIAQGQMSIAEVMHGWLKSVGHCKNLMNAGFKEVGVARYDDYWVQDFGGREPFSAEEQKLLKSGRYKLIEKN